MSSTGECIMSTCPCQTKPMLMMVNSTAKIIWLKSRKCMITIMKIWVLIVTVDKTMMKGIKIIINSIEMKTKILFKKRLLKSFRSARKTMLCLVILSSQLQIKVCTRTQPTFQTMIKTCRWLNGDDPKKSPQMNPLWSRMEHPQVMWNKEI